ncbi:hypothetical protein HOU02_gp239 [Caulobacter phage CcrBL9]|uniref:Uncharacterized protein n=1 Tax=Caulobacter phage CcrBL9 TaxID=2283270 RepID=A0A385ECS6_9CAUD|nr:hypothetical protein HOU02_gp239 [Caulobacter phage CcrBL9]AXQ69486.1 hypothetical protein CcrBL9_gp462 [Caulobacter phage CcrBL9]
MTKMLVLEQAIERFPVLLLLAQGVGRWTRLRDTSIDEPTLSALVTEGVVEVGRYKPDQRVRGRTRTFRALALTAKGELLSAMLRDAFREHNLAWSYGPDDGVGRVAMRADWGQPKIEYVADGYLGHRRKVITARPDNHKTKMKKAAQQALAKWRLWQRAPT